MRLDILAWLLVPLGATLIALVLVRWRARPKGPADAHESVAERARFRDAMAKPLPKLDPDADTDSSQDHSRGVGTVLINNNGRVGRRDRPSSGSDRGAA